MTCHDLKICSKIFHSICIWHAPTIFYDRTFFGVLFRAVLELALINFAADKAAPRFSRTLFTFRGGFSFSFRRWRRDEIHGRTFNLFALFAPFAGISIIPPSFYAIVYFSSRKWKYDKPLSHPWLSFQTKSINWCIN